MTRPSIASDPTLRLAAYLSCLFAGAGVLLAFLPQWRSETHVSSGAEIALVIPTPALIWLGRRRRLVWRGGAGNRNPG
jgi:hypothetical protein